MIKLNITTIEDMEDNSCLFTLTGYISRGTDDFKTLCNYFKNSKDLSIDLDEIELNK